MKTKTAILKRDTLKSRTSDKISVSSGTSADIISDLDVSRQATQRADRYIAIAAKSLRLKGYPPTVNVHHMDSTTGKAILRYKGVATAPAKAAEQKAAKKKVARRKAVKKKA